MDIGSNKVLVNRSVLPRLWKKRAKEGAGAIFCNEGKKKENMNCNVLSKPENYCKTFERQNSPLAFFLPTKEILVEKLSSFIIFHCTHAEEMGSRHFYTLSPSNNSQLMNKTQRSLDPPKGCEWLICLEQRSPCDESFFFWCKFKSNEMKGEGTVFYSFFSLQ